MSPVQAPFGWTVVSWVLQHVADVCCAVQLRESVTPAQVVLGAGSTDGRERGVTMDVELDFSLAEPAIG